MNHSISNILSEPKVVTLKQGGRVSMPSLSMPSINLVKPQTNESSTIKVEQLESSKTYTEVNHNSMQSGMYDRTNKPIVVPVPMGGGMSQPAPSHGTSGTQSVPNLPASPMTNVSMDYIYRRGLSAKLH